MRVEAHNGQHGITRNYNIYASFSLGSLAWARNIDLYAVADSGAATTIRLVDTVNTHNSILNNGTARAILSGWLFNAYQYGPANPLRGTHNFQNNAPMVSLDQVDGHPAEATVIRVRVTEHPEQVLVGVGNFNPPPGDGVTSDPAATGGRGVDGVIEMRGGRLRLFNAAPVSRSLPITVNAQAEYWRDGQWRLNSDDSGGGKCTTLAANSLHLTNATLFGSPITSVTGIRSGPAAPPLSSAPLIGGKAIIELAPPLAATPVSQRAWLAANLGDASTTALDNDVDYSCLPGPWVAGNNHGGVMAKRPWLRSRNPADFALAQLPSPACNSEWNHDPFAIIRFGVNNKRMIDSRELFKW
ncbi:MAG: hypothetical protein LBE62_15770 [Azonexus sp.]|jgi:hypothetical protein|nr:hypothetical protein [Azonexus sp.]